MFLQVDTIFFLEKMFSCIYFLFINEISSFIYIFLKEKGFGDFQKKEDALWVKVIKSK